MTYQIKHTFEEKMPMALLVEQRSPENPEIVDAGRQELPGVAFVKARTRPQAGNA